MEKKCHVKLCAVKIPSLCVNRARFFYLPKQKIKRGGSFFLRLGKIFIANVFSFVYFVYMYKK